METEVELKGHPVYLPDSVWRAVQRAAKIDRRSASTWMGIVIEDYLGKRFPELLKEMKK